MFKRFFNFKIYQKITIVFTGIIVFGLVVLNHLFVQTNQLADDFNLFIIENNQALDLPIDFYERLYTFNRDMRSSRQRNTFISALIIIFFVSISGKLLSDTISKPINKMVDVIEAISVGNLNVNIPKSGNDEVGSLAKAARVLKENLNDLIEDINKFKDEIVLKGNIDHRFIETAYEGSYREMAVALNKFKESMTTDVIEVINFVNSIEAGDFDVEIQELPGKKIIITLCLRSLIQNFKDISREIENVMSGTKAKLDVEKYSGEWQKIMIQLNKFLTLTECIGCERRESLREKLKKI